MYNVLLADRVAEHIPDALRAWGLRVRNEPELSASQLVQALPGVNILVVRGTKVASEALRANRDLSLVVRAGAGVNTIDVRTASELGIHVANCPGANADAVAELCWGLILAADRSLVEATLDLRAGRWRKKAYSNGHGLKTRRLGLVGFGAIGQRVAAKGRAFGMDVLVWSRSLTEETAAAHGVTLAKDPLEVARAADVVSIHVALTPETRYLVNRKFLTTMRDGAILVNTARGEVVETEALQEVLATNRLRVALDVFDPEPEGDEGDFPLTDLAARITATPHIGASTRQTSEAIAAEVLRIIEAYVFRGEVRGSVNIRQRSPANFTLRVRHFDRVGVLSDILLRLKEEDINVEEMQNEVFEGAQAAVCTVRLEKPPSQRVLDAIADNPDVLQVTLGQR